MKRQYEKKCRGTFHSQRAEQFPVLERQYPSVAESYEVQKTPINRLKGSKVMECSVGSTGLPTNLFTILEPRDQEIGGCYVNQKRRATDFKVKIVKRFVELCVWWQNVLHFFFGPLRCIQNSIKSEMFDLPQDICANIQILWVYLWMEFPKTIINKGWL